MPFGKPKEPKAPKEKKPKKPKPPKKEKPPKKPRPPKKVKPTKKPKKGAPPQGEGEEGQEGEQPQKKKLPLLLFIIVPVVVAALAAALVFFVILPRFGGPKDPEPVATEEPQPPELPEELKVGEVSVPGMALEADESGALAELAKTVTYTYTNLVDAGKAAQTYTNQLRTADPAFSLVDEEFVRVLDDPDFSTRSGMVLLARTLPKPEPEAEETSAPTEEPKEGESEPPEDSVEPTATPEPTEPPEPVDEGPDLLITVRITWSEGQCVVTADEEEGVITSPPPEPPAYSIGIREAESQIRSMTPAELGLSGASIEDYEIFSEDIVETVDDMAYIKLNLYDAKPPYAFAGSYLMAVDGKRLYRLDATTGELVELDFTLNIGGSEEEAEPSAPPESSAPETAAPESGSPE